jgi:hypothetical protein
VSHDELMFGKSSLEKCFQQTIMLHLICQTVAQDGDAIARLEIQLQSLRGMHLATKRAKPQETC